MTYLKLNQQLQYYLLADTLYEISVLLFYYVMYYYYKCINLQCHNLQIFFHYYCALTDTFCLQLVLILFQCQLLIMFYLTYIYDCDQPHQLSGSHPIPLQPNKCYLILSHIILQYLSQNVTLGMNLQIHISSLRNCHFTSYLAVATGFNHHGIMQYPNIIFIKNILRQFICYVIIEYCCSYRYVSYVKMWLVHVAALITRKGGT